MKFNFMQKSSESKTVINSFLLIVECVMNVFVTDRAWAARGEKFFHFVSKLNSGIRKNPIENAIPSVVDISLQKLMLFDSDEGIESYKEPVRKTSEILNGKTANERRNWDGERPKSDCVIRGHCKKKIRKRSYTISCQTGFLSPLVFFCIFPFTLLRYRSHNDCRG